MVRNTPVNAGDPGSIPRLGSSPGKGNGNSLLYSCLENPMDREAWLATIHGMAKADKWENIDSLYLSLYEKLFFFFSFHLFLLVGG